MAFLALTSTADGTKEKRSTLADYGWSYIGVPYQNYPNYLSVPYIDPYSTGITSYLSIPPLKAANEDLEPLKITLSHLADVKPVFENIVDIPPPQGPARVSVAIPVANPNQPVAVGSGSLGVVRLGNGGLALGSGSIGYSSASDIANRRTTQQPSTVPSATVPSQTLQPQTLQQQTVPPSNRVQVTEIRLGPEPVTFAFTPLEGFIPASVFNQVDGGSNQGSVQQGDGGSGSSTTQSLSTQNSAAPESRGYSSTVGLSGFS